MGEGRPVRKDGRLGTLRDGFYTDQHPPPGSTGGPGKPGCAVGTFRLVPCCTEVPEGRAARVPKGVSRAEDRRPAGQRSAKQLAVAQGTEGKVSVEIRRENRAGCLGWELLGVWRRA